MSGGSQVCFFFFLVPGHFISLFEGSSCNITPRVSIALALRKKEEDSSFLRDLLSAALISHQATLMAFLCTPGLSLVDGLQHAVLSPRPLHWTGEEEWGGGGVISAVSYLYLN